MAKLVERKRMVKGKRVMRLGTPKAKSPVKKARKERVPKDLRLVFASELAVFLRRVIKALKDDARRLEAGARVGSGTLYTGLLKAMEPALLRRKADGIEAALTMVLKEYGVTDESVAGALERERAVLLASMQQAGVEPGVIGQTVVA